MKDIKEIAATQFECWCKKKNADSHTITTDYWIVVDDNYARRIIKRYEHTGKVPVYCVILDGIVKLNVLGTRFHNLPNSWKDSLEKFVLLDYLLDKMYEDSERVNAMGKPARVKNPSIAYYASKKLPEFTNENIQIMELYYGKNHENVQFAKAYMKQSEIEQSEEINQ